ncbi:MAG: hypothetical protein ACXAAM_03720 [Candidatus Heimdallarchaeaceae archaeon]|jgi:hypothetical protein
MLRELSKRFTLLKTFFISFSALFLIVALMFGLSIAFYPGGNFKDNEHVGYSLLWNVMCDLGLDTSISGEINTFSQIFYRIGITSLSIIGMIYFSILWIFFQEKKNTKKLSVVGSILGVIQGGIYIGIGFTSGDLHMGMLTAGPLIEFFAILFYTIVFMKEEKVPKLSSYTFLAMFSLAIFYVIFVIIGLIVGGDFEMLIRHAGHTIFNFLIMLGYIIQGVGMYLFMKNLETNHLPN